MDRRQKTNHNSDANQHRAGSLLGLLVLLLTAAALRLALLLLLRLALRTAALVAGLLAAANMALALIGAYLLIAPGMEESE